MLSVISNTVLIQWGTASTQGIGDETVNNCAYANITFPTTFSEKYSVNVIHLGNNIVMTAAYAIQHYNTGVTILAKSVMDLVEIGWSFDYGAIGY